MTRGRKKKHGSYKSFLNREVFESIPTVLFTGDWSYEVIQILADEYLDCPVQDLCGLDTENDPFYCGAPSHRAKATWIEKYWPEIMKGRKKVSLRTVHYYLASIKAPFPEGFQGLKNLKHYDNTKECVALVNVAIKYARYLGLISYDDIVDEKSSEPSDFTGYKDLDSRSEGLQHWREYREKNLPAIPRFALDLEGYDTENLPEPQLDVFKFPSMPSLKIGSFAVPQKYHLEIWCEKSTQNYILEPIARRYQAVYQDLGGESSSTRVREAAERIIKDGRAARIAYVADYDPAGENMPRAMAVKLQHALIEKGSTIDVRLYPIALIQDQIEEYNIELIELKQSEKRGTNFAEKHKQDDKPKGAELDAIEATHRGLLAQIVKYWLDGYYDHNLEDRVQEAEEDLTGEIEELQKEALSPIQDDLDAFEKEWEAMRQQVEDIIKPVFAKRDELWEKANNLVDAKRPDFDESKLPQPEYIDEDPYPLYDSMRHRLIQNIFFQAHKRNEPFEDVQRLIDQSGWGRIVDSTITYVDNSENNLSIA